MATAPMGVGITAQAPPVTPPLHSLLASGQEVSEGDDRWEQFITFQPETCATAFAWTRECPPDPEDETQFKSEPPVPEDLVEYIPFQVETAMACPNPGALDTMNARRIRNQLEAAQHSAIEREFWTGAKSPTNPHLAMITAVQLAPSGTPTTPDVALALVNEAIAECGPGGRGMIHAPVGVATLWSTTGAITTDGARLVTKVKGNIVVAGGGYPGTAPSGLDPAAGSAWVYGTSGIAQYRLGEIQVFEAQPVTVYDATGHLGIINRYEARAERTVAVTWDLCCLVAVLVDIAGAEASVFQ